MSEPTDTDRRQIRIHCDWLRRKGATVATIYHRRECLRRLAERIPCELLAATAQDLEDWQAGLTVSISSIATYTTHVRGFYRWAVEAGHLDSDPSARLPRPKVPPRSARPIPEDHLQLVLHCAQEPLRTWLVLAGYMGLRAHEIAQIRREDITEVAGRLVLKGIGKGQKPYALVVPVEVEPYLRRYMGRRPGPLWTSTWGTKLIAKRVTDRTTALMRSLGLPYTLHWCRHRFGTAFYGATKDLLLTQDVMRHSSPSTTRLYVETTRAEATEAMDRLSASLRPRRANRRKPSPAPSDDDGLLEAS